MNRPLTYPEIKRVADLWNGGMPVMHIACETGRSVSSIHGMTYRYRDMFTPRRLGRPRRIDVPTAHRMREQGYTLKAIATRYGVSVVAVHLMFKRGTR